MIKKIDNITIDIISARLKNVVSPLDIIKWLNNFEENEIKYAIDIASNLTVYTSYEIEEVINNSLNILFPTLKPNDVLIINPIGNFGKSGSMVTYFFQKTDFHRKHKNKVKMLPTVNNFKPESNKNYFLVLLDDFVGSGNSVKTYFESEINLIKDKFEYISFIGVAGMEQGIKLINPIFDRIEIPKSNIFKKAFSSEASYFGYRNYTEHREFCFKYGKKLTSPKVRKDKTVKFLNALGYENSQALVSFSHGSPNNTLPIIWSNKNNWFPLIPRFFSDKISVSKEFRKSISYELSILKEFGSENLQNEFFTHQIKKGKRNFSSVSKIDFSIYAIIKLSRSGFTEINICQKLGILTKDYEQILEIGKERGIFNQGNNLTLFGLEIYQDAKKCIKRKKRNFEYESADYFAVKETNYLPRTFNGKS
ncbi:MAG: phosphoribosyltransferase-like protein [Mesonia hippocampi]|uniref:phosphoribosyltransferase-like protein n=1 Tax=Mesonia hippocampi TaxID=1628250 RepID=UPI003F9683D7